MLAANRRGFRSMCLIACLAATGCTSVRDYIDNGWKVGPDYRRPAAPLAQDWIDASDQRLSTESADLSQWWGVFDDPTLDALVNNAALQNLSLREAGYRVLQARAIRGAVVGGLFPQQQEAVGGYSRNALSKAAANTAFLPDRYFDQWATGFNLAWELDFWGRFRRAIEAADADLDTAVEAYDAVLVTLLGDVAASYTEIRTLQQRVWLAQRNVELQRETLTIAEARFRGGQVSELDADQAASTLAQTEALIPQLEFQLRVAINRLSVLLGMPPSDLEQLLLIGPIPTAPATLAVGIPAELLRRRPDIRAAERQVAAQSARVGIATAELYPHIGITGTIGYSAEQFGDLFGSRALQGSIGPSFQWNILNYGRLLNNIRAQDAALAELIVAYQNNVLVAQAEVENAIALFLQSQQRAMALARSVTASEKAVKVAVAEYRAGLIDFNRVVLVQQNLVQQQDLLAEAQGDIAQGVIDTYRALGGGWESRLAPSSGILPVPGATQPLPPEPRPGLIAPPADEMPPPPVVPPLDGQGLEAP